MTTARGTIDVKIDTQNPYFEDAAVSCAAQTVYKTFSGGMSGTAEARMLTASTKSPGCAGYVALDHFEGTVHGKAGSFVLLHFGTMTKGHDQSRIMISPNSGTGELAGISGTLTVHADENEHSYVLEYTLPEGR